MKQIDYLLKYLMLWVLKYFSMTTQYFFKRCIMFIVLHSYNTTLLYIDYLLFVFFFNNLK